MLDLTGLQVQVEKQGLLESPQKAQELAGQSQQAQGLVEQLQEVVESTGLRLVQEKVALAEPEQEQQVLS